MLKEEEVDEVIEHMNSRVTYAALTYILWTGLALGREVQRHVASTPDIKEHIQDMIDKDLVELQRPDILKKEKHFTLGRVSAFKEALRAI